MKSSILRNLLFSFLAFGILIAAIFPFYANFFVDWKPGMLSWFVVGCLVAGLVIGVMNYWLLNVILLAKLRRISEVSNAISRKDLTTSCSLRSADTIGEIIASFNAMTRTLRELIGEAASMSGSVLSTSGEINRVMARIRENVGTQAERAGKIGASIEHLSETVAEIAERSDHAANRAREAGEHAAQGRRVVDMTIQSMDRIDSTVSNAAQAVASLGASSERIGAIVAVIKEIAEQTNLLALNAAIEAARAGEQGRGFAVVADEVRKLAEKTTAATQEISGMIASIQAETAQAVQTIETGKGEVVGGVSRAREAGEALQKIVSQVEGLSHMVQDIAQATQTQRSDVLAVRTNIEHIGSLIEDTVQSVGDGAAKADALGDQVTSLDRAVKQFKLA
jgi:methyl-accepting chemotaxis protein